MKGRDAKDALLSRQEVTVFLNNAQVTIANFAASEERIPAIWKAKELLIKAIDVSNSAFTADEWAVILVSAAWDLFQKERN